MNLKVLEKSRKVPSIGDIFVWTMDTHNYYFGRVIKTDAIAGGFPNSLVLYFYNNAVSDYTHIPELRKEELLVPPLMTNRQGWLKGFFKTIANKPLREKDQFIPNIFEDVLFQCYKDEYGNKIEKKENREYGLYGLGGIAGIDILLSHALGLKSDEE